MLAVDVVRYQGEPVALVAADHPEIARRAAAEDRRRLRVARAGHRRRRGAATRQRRRLHPGGNLVRHLKIRKGDADPIADVVVVAATTRSACRTRRSSGRSPGWRCPPRTAASTCTSPPSGCTSTSARSARRSACRPDQVRLHAGRRRRRVRRPRGPVDARARLPARAAHRQAGEDGLQPRGVVLRPRAPAPRDDALRVRRRPRRHAGLRPGRRSTSTAAPTRPAPRPSSATPARWASAPTTIPNVHMDCYGAYTNNPPCGAMRGFGCGAGRVRRTRR